MLAALYARVSTMRQGNEETIDNQIMAIKDFAKEKGSNEHIHITKSSFERRGGGDVYYIFVLLSDEIRNFLIIPYHIINDWIRIGLADERERILIPH